MEKELHDRPRRLGWVALFVVITSIVLSIGYAYYTHEIARVRQEKYDDIAAIAKLKVGSIQEWRKGLLHDVRALSSGPLWNRAVNQWFRDPHNEALLMDIKGRLVAGRQQKSSADALLLDLDGNVIASASDQPESLNSIEKKAIGESIASGSPVLSDMYRTPDGAILIDAVSPILDPQGRPIAVALYRTDPESVLFPLIQTWPTPSQTAETLLVQKDGDDVAFLNDLRHRENTALSLREPLNSHDVPAVQAVSGKTGLFQGKDYRGVEVLADLRPIPDSPWFMVAKVDTSEILDEARYRGAVAIIFSGLFILLTAGLTAYGYRHRQARLYRSLYKSEREQREAEGLFRTTLYSIGDAVITTDTRGLAQQMNPVAERLTGWLESEARGKSVNEVFQIVQEESRAPVENPVQRVLTEGNVVGLANHTVLISRDGTEKPIADSGAPIRSEDGSILGVVLVFRDQTEERVAQKSLAESEERYSIVADFTYDWEYWVDSEGNFLYVSPSCERITGYSAEEFISDPDLMNRIIHPDDRDLMLDHYHNVRKVAPHAVDKEDFRIIRRDGEIRWIGHVCHPVYDQKGQPSGRRGSNRDITERKQSEEQVRRSEEKYLKLFQDAPLIYVLTRNEQGIPVISDCNKMFLNSVGFAREEVIGKPLANFYSPESQTRLLDDGGYARALAGEFLMGERQLMTRDGRLIRTFLYTKPETDYSGQVIGTRAMFVDITAARKAEEGQRRLAAAIDQATEGVVITDTEGTIRYVNPAIFKMCGYSPEELLGANPRILKSGEHDSIFYKQLWDTLKSGKIWSGRFINRKKDGQLYYEDATISPVRDSSGAIVNFVAVKRDITEHLELSKQLFQAQKMEAVGTLAGGVAHDFNNLLQAVLGYSELMLQRKKEGEADYADLQKIYQAGKRGANLVKSLLTFSRKAETKHVPIDLNHEITSVRDLLFRTIPKTIRIDLHLKGNLELIKADQSQISQVLMNLGVNARDAMPDGGTLTIETSNILLDEEYCSIHLETKPGSYVLLTVSDTGQGMDKEILSHIFEPFFTTKEKGRGTGLGLATVYGIVKQHGGQINCYSEPGLGTTFNIYLPAIQQVQEVETPTSETIIPGGTETVLLVDDEDDIRDLGATLIKNFGYKVVTANDGKEALEIYQRESESISLIILDLIMPVMDGKQCLNEVLRIDPKAKVIIASGYSESGSAKGVMEAGAKGYIRKPYNMRQLLTTIREVLDKDS